MKNEYKTTKNSNNIIKNNRYRNGKGREFPTFHHHKINASTSVVKDKVKLNNTMRRIYL